MSAAPGAPVQLDRDPARELLREELADPAYAADRPGLVERVLGFLLDRLDEVLAGAERLSPGGLLGLVGLLTVAAVLITLVLRRTGSPARTARRARRPEVGAVRRAAEHRAAAAAAAATGDWDRALTESFRALVAELEERGVLDPQPGRTADEVAALAGAAWPDRAAALAEAARLFDEVRYGDRPATAEQAARLRDLDAALRGRPRRGVPVPGT